VASQPAATWVEVRNINSISVIQLYCRQRKQSQKCCITNTIFKCIEAYSLLGTLAFPLSIFSRFERYMDNFVGSLPNFHNSVFSVSKRTFTGSVA
jgi:hypothetical protein